MPSRGFTLIELIIYIALIALVVTALVSFSLSVSESRAKTYVAQETNHNIRFALDVMRKEIHRSSGIATGSSTFDVDPGTLVLTMDAVSENPTIFSLSSDNGILQMTKGVGSPVALTTNDISITEFLLTDMTSSSAQASVRMELGASYIGEAAHAYATHVTTTFTSKR